MTVSILKEAKGEPVSTSLIKSKSFKWVVNLIFNLKFSTWKIWNWVKTRRKFPDDFLFCLSAWKNRSGVWSYSISWRPEISAKFRRNFSKIPWKFRTSLRNKKTEPSQAPTAKKFSSGEILMLEILCTSKKLLQKNLSWFPNPEVSQIPRWPSKEPFSLKFRRKLPRPWVWNEPKTKRHKCFENREGR